MQFLAKIFPNNSSRDKTHTQTKNLGKNITIWLSHSIQVKNAIFKIKI
jgi:hypothetical protein